MKKQKILLLNHSFACKLSYQATDSKPFTQTSLQPSHLHINFSLGQLSSQMMQFNCKGLKYNQNEHPRAHVYKSLHTVPTLPRFSLFIKSLHTQCSQPFLALCKFIQSTHIPLSFQNCQQPLNFFPSTAYQALPSTQYLQRLHPCYHSNLAICNSKCPCAPILMNFLPYTTPNHY